MACCLMAPSHYLNQYLLIMSCGIQWRAILQEMLKISILDMCLKITNFILYLHLPEASELKFRFIYLKYTVMMHSTMKLIAF